MLADLGEADSFRCKRRALIYEALAEVVDTELIRERDVQSFEFAALEIARMMRMRTVANMIPAMVEDK